MRYSSYFFIAAGVFPLYSAAQPSSINLNQVDAEQQQRQRQQQEQLERQWESAVDIRTDTAADAPLIFPQDESPCYPIHRISLIDYSSSVPHAPSRFQWALTQTLKDFKFTLPHCLGGEGLGVLMKQVQNHIMAKGFITTRVVAQEQNLRSGTLELTVIGGRIRNTIVSDHGAVPRFTPLHAWTALTFAKGDLLNVRDIEQSLENLKRVPTAEANIEIIPAEGGESEAGDSDIKISYAQALPFRLNLGLDDAGSKSTGKWQASGTLSFDNIFSANDLFYGSFTHSIKRSSDEHGRRAGKNLSFHYSVPFGYWLLSASHSQYRYHQEIFGAYDTGYIYAGESETDKITLSRSLYRDAQRKTGLSGGFWSRHSKNKIDGAEIEVQRRRMAGWELKLSHKEYQGDAVLELEGGFKRGTGARGAISAPEELWNEGTARPKIITASVNYKKTFNIGTRQWLFNTEWNAQWNKTPLIAQDRFSIGGRYTVRGFDGELTLSGERGWLWRNELSVHIANGHRFYWGMDSGRVSGRSEGIRQGHHLMGTVIGLRGGFSGFYYDYFVGRPMRKPEGFRTSDSVTGFNLGYSF